MDPRTREIVKARINKHIHLIPEHMHDGVLNYVFDFVEPGGFLTAVLENDLAGAVARADHINIHAIAEWGQFLMWAMPRAAWGSPEAVNEWLNADSMGEHDHHAVQEDSE
jgi:hypothetical protein